MFIIDALFCHVDDFCLSFEPRWNQTLLNQGLKHRQRQKSLCLSEIMTILIAFHQQPYRNFKHYYLNQVKKNWGDAFPKLPSYQVKLLLIGFLALSFILLSTTKGNY